MPRQTELSFAERLKDLQQERRFTAEALAYRSGVSLRLIQKYRAGVTEPRDSFGDPSANARKLAEALDVDVAWLLPPRDEATPAATPPAA